jgi:hypothetical protein
MTEVTFGFGSPAPVYVGGKHVGYVDDGVYFTTRDPAKHLYQLHNSYGIATALIEHLVTMNVRSVVVQVPKEGVQYVARIGLFFGPNRKSKRVHQRPYELQDHLPLPRWSVEPLGTPQAPTLF